jgi:hypothetical protein
VFDIGSRRVAVALVTLAAGGLLAACGSASSGSGSATSTTTASASAAGSSTSASGTASARRGQLAACLKAHGVTLPARPAGAPPAGGSSSGGGSAGGGGTGTGTTPRRGFFFGCGAGGRNITPKMRAAFQACGARFGGGGGGAFRGRISHAAITSFVTCVKQHGYNLPAPNFSGKGPVFPRSAETNAKFQAAAKSCQHLLIPPRASGGTSTTSGA